MIILVQCSAHCSVLSLALSLLVLPLLMPSATRAVSPMPGDGRLARRPMPGSQAVREPHPAVGLYREAGAHGSHGEPGELLSSFGFRSGHCGGYHDDDAGGGGGGGRAAAQGSATAGGGGDVDHTDHLSWVRWLWALSVASSTGGRGGGCGQKK